MSADTLEQQQRRCIRCGILASDAANQSEPVCSERGLVASHSYRDISTQLIVTEARSWASDCQWLDEDSLEGYSDAQILRGVERHYEGGLEAFVAGLREVL